MKASLLGLVKRYPVTAYFILVFVVSWGGVLLAVGGPDGMRGAKEEFEARLPIVILALLAGPSGAGLLLTGLVSGRAGWREFRTRLVKWRVGARWYAAALVTAPLLMLGILLALSRLSQDFVPGLIASRDRASHLLAGLATGLAAGLFEELGWTGFAIPRLRRRFGALATGLIVGFLWAVWHLLPAIWLGFASGTVKGGFALASYLADPFLFLVAFRVLMVWVYDGTGSLLVAMLMHVSLTSSSRIFMPLGIVGTPLMTFDLIWAAATGVVAAVAVIRANRNRFVTEET